MKSRRDKLLGKGGSQAVRAPAEFRPGGNDVRTHRDRETGEAVPLPITASWDEFFAQRERTPGRRGFLVRRRVHEPARRGAAGRSATWT